MRRCYVFCIEFDRVAWLGLMCCCLVICRTSGTCYMCILVMLLYTPYKRKKKKNIKCDFNYIIYIGNFTKNSSSLFSFSGKTSSSIFDDVHSYFA